MKLTWLWLIPILLTNQVPIEKPDTNFKTIHQIQAEQNRPDSIQQANPAPAETAAAPLPTTRFLGTTSLFVVVFVLLVIVICLLVILGFRRRRVRTS